MRLSDLNEIRRGARDLASPTKKDYTMGIEFEISATDDIINSDTSTADVDYEQAHDDHDVAWEKRNDFDFRDWFFENHDIEDLILAGELTLLDDTDDQDEIHDIASQLHRTRDLDEMNELFAEDVESMFEQEADEYQEKLRREDFDIWLDENIDNYLIGGTGAISYMMDKIQNFNLDTSGWKVVEDGTDGVDAEIVTDVMSVEDGFAALDEVFEFIDQDDDIFTSEACGLHINIGTWRGNEWQSVDWLKFLTIVHGDRILKDFGRQRNSYAADKLQGIVDAIQNGDHKNYNQSIKTVNDFVIAKSIKQSVVNLSKLRSLGYIEIRGFGNKDYHKKADKIKQTIKIILQSLDIASDPRAHRRDYLKKLAKVLGKVQDSNRGGQNRDFLLYLTTVFDTNPYVFDNLDSARRAIAHGIKQTQSNGTEWANRNYNRSVHVKFMELFQYPNILTKLQNDLKIQVRSNPELGEARWIRAILKL